ncbi:hypothetical protein GGQ97_000138 [Sphingomonas kaistensis]|uniref:STAS/SEC14 domain-containing protein n=1 Tax=Sphingomonas kaistensis TaxID=298708 RepID=A0A7X5Y5P2_9SPHN|nr:STAS/SEC14 domain-containing protein [Sphingomonas kaistensis]NJC04345.1 hypothetical protein [Sphingomonas kaistensis]
MLTIHDSRRDVLALTIVGDITGADLDTVMDRLDPLMEGTGKVHLFVETKAIHGLQLTALPSYVARAMPLLGKLDRFGRVAVVSDQAWIRAGTRLESMMLPFIAYRVFMPDERDAALAWVEGGREA